MKHINECILFILVSTNLLCQLTEAQDSQSKRIGIIGAGIGGTSTAYYLQQSYPNAEIDIFEPASRICGRVNTIELKNGRKYESGGSILHPRNMHAANLVDAFGLRRMTKVKGGSDTMGFFDGSKYVFETSTWFVVTLFRMLWTFGLDMFWIEKVEAKFIDKFSRIYDAQDAGMAFNNVTGILQYMSGKEFEDAAEMTACQFFGDNVVQRQATMEAFVNGAIRVNYGQDCNVNGFVGSVALAGIQPGLYAIQGGNNQLCSRMLEASGANLITEKVTKVSHSESNSGDRQFTVTSLSNGNVQNRSYDAVVVATPLIHDKSNIDVTDVCQDKANCPSAQTDSRRYRRTVATFVRGRINSTTFLCTTSEQCHESIILTGDKELFYRSIGLQSPVDHSKGEEEDIGAPYYKIFSSDILTEDQLEHLFEEYDDVQAVDWLAYPAYQPPDKLSSFVLNTNGVYYTSPIEWAASAIEMSLISGKNAALLVTHQLSGNNFRNTQEEDTENVSGKTASEEL